jgi:proteasome lid subunit RPN8/RPN11
MKPALTIFLFLITCSWMPCISAQSVKISNKEGKAVGEFETQAYLIDKGEFTELNGLGGTVDLTDREGAKILFRLKNLYWMDKDLEKKSIEILKSKIRIRKDIGMEVSSKASKFRLSPNNKDELDIYFAVNENGNYRIEFPFSAGSLDGRMSRSINVEGLPEHQDKASEADDLNLNEADESREISEDLSNEENDSKKEDQSESDKKASGAKKLSEAKNSKISEDTESFESLPGGPAYKIAWLPENIVEITTQNLSNPIIETLSHPEELSAISNMKGVLQIKVSGSRPYFIKIRGDEGLLLAEFDNSLQVDVEEGSEELSFNVKGGISPYAIQFLQGGENVSTAAERFDNLEKDANMLIVFTHKDLSTQLDGEYTHAIISDATAENQVEVPLTLTIKKETGNTTLIIAGLLGLVLIGGLWFFIAGRKKNIKREEYKRKALLLQQQEAANQATMEDRNQVSTKTSENANDGPARKISIQKSKPERTPLEFASRDRSPTTSGKLKIKWRENRGGLLETSAFMSLVQSRNAAELDLLEHWSDTMVDKVYLSPECIHDLGAFLKKENLSKMQSELQGAIPEVGGFLMGNHSLNPEGDMHIFIDKFVPFVPEYHDVFKIEIGTQTLVQELGDAQDNHPDMDLIGWFHTHPGHGLFLSNSDLSVQKHFAQPFQVAMEIDSLTGRLDTAFFTRKRSGRMNNVEHRNEGAVWFAWKEIEKTET